jgi:hypothetical protein
MEQNYWVIIPPLVAGSNISIKAKYLYGRIYALSQKDGYCYASNEYLCLGTGLMLRSLQRALVELKKAGFINIEIVTNEKKEFVSRHISITTPMSKMTPPHVKNDTTPHVKNDTIDIESILDKEISNTYTAVFELWNSLGIIKHTSQGKTYEQFKRAINGLIKEGYKQEDIMLAMKNYAKILNSPEYYWKHKWTAVEFLTRGFERFKDWTVCSQNFKNKSFSKPTQKRFEGEDFSKYDKFN